MNDTCRPHRIEVLGSRVGEMRSELFHTRGQIEQMMGMMQQLHQAKSAGGGQQEEQSGGSGRGDADDDSGGAGRSPREEGAAGPKLGSTTETAEGEKMSSHSSRALDGSRPADDTGRRPEVPAGVGLMMNMQYGEARDSFLLGVTYDGDGVLNSSFQRQSRVVPPALKAEKREFKNIKLEFLLKANMLDIWPLRK